nr:YfgG family protein [Pantoea sp. 1.19]
MNHAMKMKRQQKTGLMTRIVLLISFLILLGRLLYAIPGAIEHRQQKQQAQSAPATSLSVQPVRDNP